MIGRLTGNLMTKEPPFIVIDVHGVGYEVCVPMSTFYNLPDLGASVTLLIHHHVREDAQILFGFYQEKERYLFRELIKVSGVGPKMALTILSGMDSHAFFQCIHHRDIASLTQLPGVGKKTAERLMIEMTGKLKENTQKFSPGTMAPSVSEEAIHALLALGYKREEAVKAISLVAEKDLNTTDLIRRALQGLAKV